MMHNEKHEESDSDEGVFPLNPMTSRTNSSQHTPKLVIPPDQRLRRLNHVLLIAMIMCVASKLSLNTGVLARMQIEAFNQILYSAKAEAFPKQWKSKLRPSLLESRVATSVLMSLAGVCFFISSILIAVDMLGKKPHPRCIGLARMLIMLAGSEEI